MSLSFRAKTILGVAAIEAVLLGLLIASALDFMRDSHESQMRRYAQATVSSFAALTADAVLAFDLARLNSFARELVANPGIAYARIRDADGRDLAEQSERGQLRQAFKPDTTLEGVTDGIYDTSAPILVAGERYGQVEVGIRVDDLQEIFAQTRFWTLSIAGGEMVLVALFSLALGTYLTRQLAHLKQGAGRLAAGELGYQIPVQGGDELAATATAFNAMSQRLRTRTDQLSGVFALSPDGFLSLDSRGVVALVNPALCHMLGVAEDQLLGCRRDEVERLLAALTTAENPFTGLDDILARTQPEGDATPARVIFEVRGPPRRSLQVQARTGQQQDVAILLHFRDVSHELEVDRMKSEFLSAAAHELRTPMASIFGFSELLLHQDFSDARRKELLGIVHDQSALLVRIVNELLDLARIEARAGKDFKRQDLDALDFVQRALEGLPPEDRPRFSFAPAPASLPSTLRVFADPDKLRQAFSNILSNAGKYSAPTSPVTVSLVEETSPARPMVGLRVEDRGVGLTPEQQARMFDRFWRADTSGQTPGTGLGMSLVKEIVELHDGRVEIQSRPGEGTRVTLWLPRQGPLPAAA
jgi:signal transduction histidine kinase